MDAKHSQRKIFLLWKSPLKPYGDTELARIKQMGRPIRHERSDDVHFKGKSVEILLDQLQRRHVPKRNRTVRLHPLPARQLLPLLRHDFPVDLRSKQLSGPRRPVRLQALHSRQLLLRNRPLRS